MPNKYYTYFRLDFAREYTRAELKKTKVAYIFFQIMLYIYAKSHQELFSRLDGKL